MMLKSYAFACFLVVSGAVSAAATTIRYEFEVVDSRLDLSTITARNPSGEESEVGRHKDEYAAAVAVFHPWNDLLGRTGQVVLELDELDFDPAEPPPYWQLTCVSGFLCEPRYHVTSNRALVFGDQTFGWETGAFTGWAFSGDALAFDDDLNQSGGGYIGDIWYDWRGADARLSLSNVTRTIVTPIPIPASGWLLLLIAPVFAWLRRRSAGIS